VYDFDRQRAIGNYIVDFYCKDLQLAIEVDGITYEEEKTKWKDEKRIPYTLQLSSRSSHYENQKSRDFNGY
jgi:very-short-patch-repair endonuclease